MIRYSHGMTCLMAYQNKKGTEAISIVLQTIYPLSRSACNVALFIIAPISRKDICISLAISLTDLFSL